MKLNKKALTQSMIIKVILAIVTLIFLFSLFNTYTQLAELKSKELGCRQFFSNNLIANNLFFTDTYDTPSEFLKNSIIQTCPSKTVEVSKNSVENAVSIITSCYTMTGQGKDILRNTKMRDQALCIYCGEIKATQDIDNFNELLSKRLKISDENILFEETEYLNTNNVFLDEKNIPKKIAEDESLSVFYYIYKPDYDIPVDLESEFGDPVGFTKFSIQYYADELAVLFNNNEIVNAVLTKTGIMTPTQSIGGVVLANQKELTQDNLLEEKVSIKGPFPKCQLFVPLEHYN